MAAHCSGPSTKIGANCWKRSAPQAISSSPTCCPATATKRSNTPDEHGWEGVVAKKRDSTYQPGRRSASWIKDKHWNTQEIVIGGWRAG